MEAFETQVQEAIASGVLPGIALLAANRSGTLAYSRSFGQLSPDPARAHEPFLPTTILRLASATKLIAQVAALQVVERGLIGLDDDVRAVVNDLKDVKILTGYEGEKGDQPVFVDPKGKITLRNLLSHSSGFRYVPIDPLLIKWREIHGEKELEPGGPFNNRFLLPLTAEPDTRWAYAFGLDWAGRVVETLTGGTLHDWVVEHIAKPLGSDSMTFFPQQRLDLLKRRADYAKAPDSTTSFPSQRPPEGGQAAPVHSEDGRFILANAQYHEKDAEDCFGGYGLWASAQDLFEVCRSLLLKDGRLLKAETIDEGLKPQLTKSAEEAMAEALKNTMHDDWGMGAGFQHHSKRSASLFGMRLQEENERTPRKEGTVAWVGYPNVFYFIDPKAGLCGVFAPQIVPPGDPKTLKLHIAWERAIYAEHERLEREARH